MKKVIAHTHVLSNNLRVKLHNRVMQLLKDYGINEIADSDYDTIVSNILFLGRTYQISNYDDCVWECLSDTDVLKYL